MEGDAAAPQYQGLCLGMKLVLQEMLCTFCADAPNYDSWIRTLKSNSKHSLQQEWSKIIGPRRLHTSTHSVACICAQPISRISGYLTFSIVGSSLLPVPPVNDAHPPRPLSCRLNSDVLVLCDLPSCIRLSHDIPNAQRVVQL